VLSQEEWDIYQRTIGGFARTYTEQQAIGREELDASTAITFLYHEKLRNLTFNSITPSDAA
jgi:hypothetical protein